MLERGDSLTPPAAVRRDDLAIRPVAGAGLAYARAGRVLLDVPEIALSGSGISVVMGPNGAGKSLLIRILAGLVAPDGGTVTWAGRPPDRARAARLGFVFQKPVLLRRSVIANMRYALRASGVSRAEVAMRARAALEAAGLAHLAEAPARLLSGGEQQRLATARALALEPECLFLDEPAASLDPASTAAIEAMVIEAQARGTKIVLITHDVGQARRLADEVLFMHAGSIVERAPAERFFAAPESAAARRFLAGEIVV